MEIILDGFGEAPRLVDTGEPVRAATPIETTAVSAFPAT
jgi:hypothetical protein